jgi:hypothetical protein
MSLWQALKFESEPNYDFSDDIREELMLRLRDVLNNSGLTGKTAFGATLISQPYLQVVKEGTIYEVSIIQRMVNDTTAHIENVISVLQAEITTKAAQFKIQITYNSEF